VCVCVCVCAHTCVCVRVRMCVWQKWTMHLVRTVLKMHIVYTILTPTPTHTHTSHTHTHTGTDSYTHMHIPPHTNKRTLTHTHGEILTNMSCEVSSLGNVHTRTRAHAHAYAHTHAHRHRHRHRHKDAEIVRQVRREAAAAARQPKFGISAGGKKHPPEDFDSIMCFCTIMCFCSIMCFCTIMRFWGFHGAFGAYFQVLVLCWIMPLFNRIHTYC